MSTSKVRPATAVDIPAMLQLSATKREQYEEYQPHPLTDIRRSGNVRQELGDIQSLAESIRA